ncbi:phage terminase small subunit [Brevibacillus agri]|uniref:phage terminase small subunit n=2 Tax=Brevibacillus agri TaxID=51101 RepID=UPI002867E30D|nr:phage terminase small subunit [Brevibacillus agri]
MAKARSPNRERALQIWLERKGDITNRELAELLGEKEKTISNWKSRDQWNVVLQTGECSTTIKRESKAGAPKGNKNAVGNSGGAAPKRNSNAVTHGFFRKFFPDETLEIMEQIETRSPLDMLWDNIVIQYTAIIRAQQIMFVRDQQDETRVLKKQKDGETSFEQEWEYQHAWDKQATFLQAQSRAMATLQSLIRQYDDMCNKGLATEEQRLRVEKLKLEVGKLREPGNDEKGIVIQINYGEER